MGNSNIRITFFGVRGLIPVPGKSTIKFGGNTPCILLEFGEQLIIVDAGTGIKNLGNELISNNKILKDIYLFITHTHWDHIQGFPFFLPIYKKNTLIHVFGPTNFANQFEKIFKGQMKNIYFPVDFKHLNADFKFYELTNTTFDINNVHIKTLDLNHPILSLAYRFEYNGKSIVTFFDYEPIEAIFKEENNKGLLEAKQVIREFLYNADIVIHDTTYKKGDYFLGCGHSYIDYAIDNCLDANVKKVCLFHYSPEYDDNTLDKISHDIILRYKDKDISVLLARENKGIKL